MPKTPIYDNDSITSLKGADRVRKRPAVIFGSDGIEGCEHSVFEILSNSVDEAREGYGNKIYITVTNDGVISITCEANTGGTRTATLTISAADCSPVTVTLTQNSSDTPVSIILSFPDDNMDNNKISSYTSDWLAKIGDYSWTITAFNNNSWKDWKYIKCGSKNAATVASIATVTPIPNKVTKVIVTFDKISAPDKIKSASLIVASDAEYATVLETVPMTLEKALAPVAKEYVVSSPAEGAYYKLVFDMDKTSSNGTIQISKIEYVRSK